MKYLVAAASCVLDKNEKLHVDTFPATLDEPKATFVFAFDSVEKRVIASHTTGSFSSDVYQTAIELCKTQCEQIFEFFRGTFSPRK